MNKKVLSSLISIISLFCLSFIISAQDPPAICGETWNTADYTQYHSSKDIVYGNSQFVTVGFSNIILTSGDGMTWTMQTPPAFNDLMGVAFGTGKFVAVGMLGVVLTSEDAITWSAQSSGTSTDLMGITYGGNCFIAVGKSGVLLTSSNGINWTPQTSGTTSDLLGIIYDGSQFVAVGYNGGIHTSPDGIQWSAQNSGTSYKLYNIAYDGTTYVVVGSNGTILTSTDTLQWTPVVSGITSSLIDIASGPDGFAAVGKNGIILTSTDGSQWIQQTSGVTGTINGILYADSRFVAVGYQTLLYSLCQPVEPPSITITAPNGGESWQTGTQQTITWETTGNITGNLEISLWQNNVLMGLIAENISPGSGSYQWTTGQLLSGGTTGPGTGFTVKIKQTGSEDPFDVSDDSFSIFQPVTSGTTIVYGRVFDADTDSPLSGVKIHASGCEILSNTDGCWQLALDSGGTIKIEISKTGYTSVYRKIFLRTGEEGTVDPAYLTPSDPAVTPIGTAGGTHATSDGSVEIIIPAGALDEEKQISATRLNSSKALPGGLNETDNPEYPINFLFCADFGPDHTTFNSPVTIRVQNSWGLAPGTEIPYAYWDTDAHKWVPISGMAVVDAQGQWLEAQVTHFTSIDINPPSVPAPDAGKPDIDLEEVPKDDDCGIGSSVNITAGHLKNGFTIPGVKTIDGDTSISFIYNSAEAYPTLALRVRNHQEDLLVVRPQCTSLYINSPLLGVNGTGKRMVFNTPQTYGSGGIIVSGNYPSGRPITTGYLSFNLRATNYYPGEIATTPEWGGMPTGSTGVSSPETAYLEEVTEKQFFIHSRADSPFGKGWGITGMQKLHIEDNRIVLVESDGTYKEYEKGADYAHVDHGAVVSGGTPMINPQSILRAPSVQVGSGDGFARFSILVPISNGINQEVVVDLGQQRSLYRVGVDFPRYWNERNVWDYVGIFTSTDNQNWNQWLQQGEPTLAPDVGDPLDRHINSPVMASADDTSARYIKIEAGFPAINCVPTGSTIKRVYAVGDQSQFRLLNGETWPKLSFNSTTGHYTVSDITGDSVVFDGDGLMIRKTDRRDRVTSFSYSGDRLTRIDYPGGAYMEFTYDGNGNLDAVRDSSGRETDVQVDSGGNLTGVVYPDARSRQFAYNARGLMTMDKTGDAEKNYTWDNEYPVLKQVRLPNDKARTIDAAALKYLLNDRDSSIDDPIDFPMDSLEDIGMDSTVTFEDGRVRRRVVGKGWSATYVNGKLREKIHFADAGNNKVPYRVERGIGGWETTEITYNDHLQPTRIQTEMTDQFITYRSNPFSYEPVGGDTTHTVKDLYLTYNDAHLVSEVEERFTVQGASSVRKLYTYDSAGNVTRAEERVGTDSRVTDYTYDAAHRLTRVDYPDGRFHEYVYDAAGLLAEMKNSDGTKAVFTRNDRGDIMSVTDEENRTVTFERDIMGRVTREISPTGRSVQYEWNSPGCQSCGEDVVLTKIIDSGNKEWEFKYDIMGNATEMIYPDGTKIVQAYDDAGRLVKFTNKRGQEISYSYDADSRLIRKTLPEGQVTFTYDDRDRVTRINGGHYDYVYQYGLGDELIFEGPVVKETDQVTGTWQVSAIDHMGAPRRLVDSFGWETDYEYGWQIGQSPFGVPSRVFIKKSGQYTEQRIDYTYDRQLRITSKSAYQMKSTDYSYDTNGVLNKMEYAFCDVWMNPVHGELNFSRDHSGLITGVTGDRFFTVSYNNDLEIESVQHTAPMPYTEQYTYDARGNRLTAAATAYTYDDLNRLTGSTTHQYTYDADGNMTEVVNTATTETRKYIYDSENRLTGYEHYPTATDSADVTAVYTYDIYGRRLRKDVDGTVTHFFWLGNNISMELDGSYQPLRKYIYNPGMDDVEGHLEYSEVVDWNNVCSRFEGWYYYAKDHVGTIYKVADMGNEQISDERTYDVFGNLTNRIGSSGCNLGFQGKYYDDESGLYYFYQRYYNPVTGRFINEDPIGFDGGLNLYGFVNNNPLKWIDPFGMDFTDDHPGWLSLFCLLWKSTPNIGGIEYGSWLYTDDTGDLNKKNWWRSPYPNANFCYPRTVAKPYKTLAGSCHTHPRKLDPGPSEADKKAACDKSFHHGKPMYIISEKGIRMFDPSTKSITELLDVDDFKKWCKCNGYL